MATLESLIPQDYIGLPLRITIMDGRVLEGILTAVDNKPNLLINNTSETSTQRGKTNKRDLGLVSVPDATIATIEIDQSELDKTLYWKNGQLDATATANQ